MNIQRIPLTDKAQTAREIKNLVDSYHTDLNEIFLEKRNGTRTRLSDMSLPDFFEYVRRIPYRRDPDRPHPQEIIARPYYIFKHRDLGYDCKKKCIALASFLKVNGIPFRFIGSSQRKDKKVHHIFPQAYIDGEWKNVDATYNERGYELFAPKDDLTYAEVL